MKNTDEPIVVEQFYDTTVEKLWEAITVAEQMKQWFFGNISSFKAEVGFTTSFEVRLDDRKFTHIWEVTEVIPKQKISYKWTYLEYPGDSLVSFEIKEKVGLPVLILTHKVLESFPGDVPEFKRESGIIGWNYFICQMLKEYLEGKQ